MIKVLITTPDYFPKLGGLTTFTDNIIKALSILGVESDLFVWKNIADIKKYKFQYNYDLVLNVHFMGGYFLKRRSQKIKMINFCHGSEILMTSPSVIKRYYKKIIKHKVKGYFEHSYRNICISGYTLAKLRELGISLNIERDLVIYNPIDTKKQEFNGGELSEKILKLICLGRDVPHKNLEGAIEFASYLAQVSACQVELYITKKTTKQYRSLRIINIENISEKDKEELLSQVHFNLLFSLDHSKKGFIEGFGLTVLEAGKYGVPSVVLGTGGLCESVHDDVTGWILEQIDENTIRDFWNSKVCLDYDNVSKQCYHHTTEFHNLNNYAKLLKEFLL